MPSTDTIQDWKSQLPNIGGIITHFSLVSIRLFQHVFSHANSYIYGATRCDERGRFLVSDAPPAVPTTQPTTNWAPFHSRVGFELADFAFTEAELSKAKVNRLLELWAATLVPYGIRPPMTDHADLL